MIAMMQLLRIDSQSHSECIQRLYDFRIRKIMLNRFLKFNMEVLFLMTIFGYLMIPIQKLSRLLRVPAVYGTGIPQILLREGT